MEISNSFTVDAPISEAWELLTDIPEIAPCLPGAKLTSAEDGVYSGGIKIKVGPVTAEYKGSAEFVERDEENYKAVINGKGRDTRGAGNAQALITAQMVPVGDQTQVDIVTDLKVSGKVAQFGRGVMQDISTKLLGQFADCLEAKIKAGDEPAAEETEAAPIAAAADAAAAASGSASPQDGDAESTAPAADTSSSDSNSSDDDDEVLDLGDIGLGSVVAKQAAPALGALAAVWLIFKFFRRGSGGAS